MCRGKRSFGKRVEHQTQGKKKKKLVVGWRLLDGEPWESLGNFCSRTRSAIVIGDLVGLPEEGKEST